MEDLSERGLLEDVLIVMAGEFGRTPKVFTFPGAETKLPGRDHWGAVQTVFLRAVVCVVAWWWESLMRRVGIPNRMLRRPRTWRRRFISAGVTA